MSAPYTCEHCGGSFVSAWSEAECADEAQELWGHIPTEDRAELCNDCFLAFIAWWRGLSAEEQHQFERGRARAEGVA